MESYPATFQIALRCDKILAIGAQREMEHASARTRRWRTLMTFSGRKKRKGRLTPCYENRNTFPHSRVASFEPEDIDIPVCRTSNILDGERDVIESLQFKHFLQLNYRSGFKKAKFRGDRWSWDRSIAGTLPMTGEIDLAKMRARRCVSTHA
jgi:hypothetical protein